MVTITLYAKQKKRHRCTEQTFGLCGRRGWDVLRTALKQVYYQGWNRSPAQVGCMIQVLRPGALGRPRGIGWRARWEGGSGWGLHVTPWLIHVSVWKNPLHVWHRMNSMWHHNKSLWHHKTVLMTSLPHISWHHTHCIWHDIHSTCDITATVTMTRHLLCFWHYTQGIWYLTCWMNHNTMTVSDMIPIASV